MNIICISYPAEYPAVILKQQLVHFTLFYLRDIRHDKDYGTKYLDFTGRLFSCKLQLASEIFIKFFSNIFALLMLEPDLDHQDS